MLSNSDPKNVTPHDHFFENLYAPFHIHRVSASRMINSVGHGRGKISELIITNYETGKM
jgi:DNA adenine methylase